MEKLIGFIKGHPMLVTLVAVGVLVVIFWPSSNVASGDGGQNAEVAAAIAASHQANAQLQLSSDQVRALGIQTAAAQAINDSNNTAAMKIAEIQAGVNKDNIAAELQYQTASLATATTMQAEAGKWGLAQAIVNVVPTTQATSAAYGQQTDAAAFSLIEMFRNIMNSDKGIGSVQTLFTTGGVAGTTATSIGADGKAIQTLYQAQNKDAMVANISNPDGSYKLFQQAFAGQNLHNAQAFLTQGAVS